MNFDALQNDLDTALRHGNVTNQRSFRTTKDETKEAIGSLFDKYQMLEELGHGAYGTVTKARKRIPHSPLYAIKHIDKKKAGAKGLSEVFSEVETMSLLHHPNIVHLEEVFQDEENLWIVMDYVPGGELQKALKNVTRFDEPSARRMAINLLMATDYIHDKGIVHRDLKPANCLLSEEGDMSLQIADFGFAVMVLGQDSCLTSFCGTTAFMAPEIILDINYGKPVDMWAIGVILFLLLSGDYPFDPSDGDQLNEAIVRGRYSFSNPVWKGVSTGAKDLISKLLVVDPSRRLTARDALKHFWVRAGMTEAVDCAIHSDDDESEQRRCKRCARTLLRGGIIAVAAAHRLVFGLRCIQLRREGCDLPLLRNFSYLVSGRYDPPQRMIRASGAMVGNAKAMLHLIAMLEHSDTTDTFDVSSNGIDSLDVTQQIVRVASSHPSLTALDLQDNPIPPLAGRALQRLARATTRLRSINVGGTQIGADVAHQINQSLKESEKKRQDSIPSPRVRLAIKPQHPQRIRAKCCVLQLWLNTACQAESCAGAPHGIAGWAGSRWGEL